MDDVLPWPKDSLGKEGWSDPVTFKKYMNVAAIDIEQGGGRAPQARCSWDRRKAVTRCFAS